MHVISFVLSRVALGETMRHETQKENYSWGGCSVDVFHIVLQLIQSGFWLEQLGAAVVLPCLLKQLPPVVLVIPSQAGNHETKCPDCLRRVTKG